MSTKKNQNEPGKKVKVGDKLTRIGGVFYKPWAAKSTQKCFVLCKWCNSEFLSKTRVIKKVMRHQSSTKKKKNNIRMLRAKN